MHEVETTVDFCPRNPVLTWMLGGLNFQIEHHLFPRVPHTHYPKIAEIVRRNCVKHGVRYSFHPRSAVPCARTSSTSERWAGSACRPRSRWASSPGTARAEAAAPLAARSTRATPSSGIAEDVPLSRIRGRSLDSHRDPASAPSQPEGPTLRLSARVHLPAKQPLGRAFRWYIPGRFHTPVPADQKARLEAEGMSFREAWALAQGVIVGGRPKATGHT